MPDVDLGNLMRSLGPELQAMLAPAEDDNDSLPVETPGVPAPAPRRAPAEITLSAEWLSEFKASYGPRAYDHRSRLVGQRPDVREWIDQLKPGPVRWKEAS
jgi:hypothetical protein